MAGSSSVASTSIMDIDGYKKSVLAPPGTVPSVHVNAHPLVLLNISEHWTRTRAQNGRPQTGKSYIMFREKLVYTYDCYLKCFGHYFNM